MKHLLNTLFVTSQDAYLALEGETVVVYREKQAAGRFPLHTLSGILSFSYAGASPALMGACAQRGVNLAFCTPRGRFLARAVGPSHGSVLLRRTQYRFADDPAQSGQVARNFLFGKVYNARWSIERTLRDHALRVDAPRLKEASLQLRETLPRLAAETDPGSLRGLEGAAAALYFGVLDDMILNGKDAFFFHGRSRRHLWTHSTLCSPSPIPCWPMTAPPPWRRRVWTPMWGFSTGTGLVGSHWRWI